MTFKTLRIPDNCIVTPMEGTMSLIGAETFRKATTFAERKAAARRRAAFHESGHTPAALTFGAPIIAVTIDGELPHLHRGHWHSDSAMALANMCVLCLAGPAAEEFFVRPIIDGADRVDVEMAKRYLAEAGVDPLLIGVEIGRCRDAANGLVRTDWARDRIQLIAAALLERGTLSGEEICGLKSGFDSSAFCPY
jgi:hypothetical protein